MNSSFINSAADAPCSGDNPTTHRDAALRAILCVSRERLAKGRVNDGTVSEKGPVPVGRAQGEYLDSL